MTNYSNCGIWWQIILRCMLGHRWWQACLPERLRAVQCCVLWTSFWAAESSCIHQTHLWWKHPNRSPIQCIQETYFATRSTGLSLTSVSCSWIIGVDCCWLLLILFTASICTGHISLHHGPSSPWLWVHILCFAGAQSSSEGHSYDIAVTQRFQPGSRERCSSLQGGCLTRLWMWRGLQHLH